MGRLAGPLLRQVEIQRLAAITNRAVEIRPLPEDLPSSLVDIPAAAVAVPAALAPPVELEGIVLDPVINGGVVHGKATLGHHLLEVAVAQRVPAVSAHAQ